MTELNKKEKYTNGQRPCTVHCSEIWTLCAFKIDFSQQVINTSHINAIEDDPSSSALALFVLVSGYVC